MASISHLGGLWDTLHLGCILAPPTKNCFGCWSLVLLFRLNDNRVVDSVTVLVMTSETIFGWGRQNALQVRPFPANKSKWFVIGFFCRRQLTDDDKAASLQQEKSWLKLRQLVLRSLAAASYLIPIPPQGASNTPTNNGEGPGHEEVLGMLIEQLERYLGEAAEDPITHRKVWNCSYI